MGERRRREQERTVLHRAAPAGGAAVAHETAGEVVVLPRHGVAVVEDAVLAAEGLGDVDAALAVDGERRPVGEIGLAGDEVADQRLDELEAGDRLLRRGARRVLAARRRVDVGAGSRATGDAVSLRRAACGCRVASGGLSRRRSARRPSGTCCTIVPFFTSRESRTGWGPSGRRVQALSTRLRVPARDQGNRPNGRCSSLREHVSACYRSCPIAPFPASEPRPFPRHIWQKEPLRPKRSVAASTTSSESGKRSSRSGRRGAQQSVTRRTRLRSRRPRR